MVPSASVLRKEAAPEHGRVIVIRVGGMNDPSVAEDYLSLVALGYQIDEFGDVDDESMVDAQPSQEEFSNTQLDASTDAAAPASKTVPIKFEDDYEHEQKEFQVHEQLLRTHSPFFEAQFNSFSADIAGAAVITLANHSPKTFEVYRGWVYHQYIYMIGWDESNLMREKTYRLLCECYVLGIEVKDTDFQDAIIDCIIEIAKETHKYAHYNSKYVYENTPPNSGLRRLLIDYVLYGKPQDYRFQSQYLYNQESLADMLEAVLVGRQKGVVGKQKIGRPKKITTGEVKLNVTVLALEAPYLASPCHYHEHASKPCYRTKYLP